jgi:hypothetical protein
MASVNGLLDTDVLQLSSLGALIAIRFGVVVKAINAIEPITGWIMLSQRNVRSDPLGL